MYVVVHAAVAAVDIHVDRGVYHRVVERRIEHGLLVVAALHFEYAQSVVPLAERLGANLVERLAVGLGAEVAQRPFGAHGRKSDANLELVRTVGFELKPSRDLAARHLGKILVEAEFAPKTLIQDLRAILIAVMRYRLGERGGEVGVVLARPAVGDAVARDERVALDAYARPQGLAVVIVDAVFEVDYHALVRPIGERVAMHARALRRREFGADARILQYHFIESRLGLLRLGNLTRAVSRSGIGFAARIQTAFARLRHDEYIAQIGVARTVQVGMAEAQDCRVVVLVPRAIAVDILLVLAVDVVRRVGRVGTELHRAVRHAGARKGVSHLDGPDERVDIRRRLLLRIRIDCEHGG